MDEPLSPSDRVKMVSSTDPDPIPVGTKGIVQNSVEFQGLMIYGVKWDNGRTLNLCEGEDEWEKVQ